MAREDGRRDEARRDPDEPAGSAGPSARSAVGRPSAQPGVPRAAPPGLPLIALLLAFSAVCFGMFFAFRSDCGSTIHALRAHGTRHVAFVAKTRTNRYGERTTVDVTFADTHGTHLGRLCVPSGGSLPKGLTKGSAVAVVYDTRRPSRVMLASQLTHRPGRSPAMLLSLSGGTLFLALATAVAVRRWSVRRAL